jgi:hypothetical protein
MTQVEGRPLMPRVARTVTFASADRLLPTDRPRLVNRFTDRLTEIATPRHELRRAPHGDVALTKSYWIAALFLAAATAPRLGAQAKADTSSDVTTEFLQSRGQTLVTMEKQALDPVSRLGAFYAFPGRTQQGPAPELTLHLVRSANQWAWAYDHTVVLVLDDRSRVPLPGAMRSATVGEGYMLEQIMMPLSRDQAAQVAQARKVTLQVGGNAFVWSDTLQRAFREIVASAGGSAR